MSLITLSDASTITNFDGRNLTEDSGGTISIANANTLSGKTSGVVTATIADMTIEQNAQHCLDTLIIGI